MKTAMTVAAILLALVPTALHVPEAGAGDSVAEVNLKVNVLPLLKEVDIDIMPFSRFNIVIPCSCGLIPVAILSSTDFYAPREVDDDSLTFGRTGDEESLFFCLRHPIDTNGDGFRDKICFFRSGLTDFRVGCTEGILKGSTVKGIPFQGRDVVWVMPLGCGEPIPAKVPPRYHCTP
ncbi:MAG: hypothetical protein R6U89_07560 [Dehalococcoidia bacterium]